MCRPLVARHSRTVGGRRGLIGARVLRKQAAVGGVERRRVNGFACLQRAQAALRIFAIVERQRGHDAQREDGGLGAQILGPRGAVVAQVGVQQRGARGSERDRGGDQHDHHEFAGDTAARVADGQQRSPRTALVI